MRLLTGELGWKGETMPRRDELWTKIRELVGDVETPGTLRRQAADLGAEMGDHGVLMAIDRATDGAWMPPAVRYKYQHLLYALGGAGNHEAL